MQRVPMTPGGFKKLQEELEHLKSKVRPKVINSISEARAHGDLKENAEYHAAREQQSFVEARISDLESKISRAQVIDVVKMPNNGRVIFGATVELINLDTDEVKKYQIVGEDEADVKVNKISLTSPIARGMIGKQEGDVVMMKTPNGDTEYEISKVAYR